MRIFLWCSALIIAFGIAGCDEGGNQKSYLPGYTGAVGELLIVSKQYYWESAVGEALQQTFLAPQAGLPHAQPRFTVQHFREEDFGKLFHHHRNILKVIIQDFAEAEKGHIEVMKNVHANGQLVVNIYASSEERFLELFDQNKENLAELFNSEERNRLQQRFLMSDQDVFRDKISEKFGYSFIVPEGYAKAKMKNNFLWLRNDQIRNEGGISHDVMQGIMMYQYPYIHDSTFTMQYLANMRDSVTSRYVHGPIDSSHMIVEHYIPPETKEVNLNGAYAVEMRGLFKYHRAMMGGPFISLSVLNGAGTMVTTIEGYVFAPQFDKREYVRELEAVIYSISEDVVSAPTEGAK